MKQIPLSQGLFALVDDEDFEWLSRHKWHAHWDPKGGAFYAQRSIYLGKHLGEYKASCIQMHREIKGLSIGDPRRVDHRDPEDTLNNQKTNLRFCSRGQNRANSAANKNNKSGIKGVRKHGKKWVATIRCNGHSLYLGTHDTKEEAGAAYRKAAVEKHGEFARP